MDKPDEPKLTLATKDGQPVTAAERRKLSPAERLELERQEELARRAAIAAAREAAKQSDKVARAKAKKAAAMRGWQPTSQQRRLISVALAAGLKQEEVAGVIGVSVRTLQKRTRKELDDGASMINAKVASKLFSKCMKGDTIALIFWAKARLGWKDRPARFELTGKDGGPIQHETVQAEADAFTSRIASMADRFAKVMASDADEDTPANDGGLTQKSTEAVGE